jgi:hypothetical protein
MSKRVFDTVEINTLYEDGYTTYQIAQKLNCSDETVRKRITNIRSISDRNKNRDYKKISESCKKKWKDTQYIEKVKKATNTIEYKMKLSMAAKINYTKGFGKWVKTEDASKIISENTKNLWKTDSYRNKQSVHFLSRTTKATESMSLKLKSDDKFRQNWVTKLRSNIHKFTGFISSTQRQLYYILSQSDIQFHEEGERTRVGPFYVVDCIIPKQQKMEKDLIIEVQGEYWHSLYNVVIKDRQRKTYIKNHTDYNLLYLEELDLASWSEVSAKLSSFGLTLKSYNFTINDLELRKITEKDAQNFYGIFHYSNTIRKGALTFGAYYNNILVVVISYTYPIRTQVASNLKVGLRNVMEISRMARATNINCENLMSWLIGKTRKLLPDDVKIIISYSDTSFGHTGGVYKACGFTNDREIEPDYHYVSMNGKYHKKTIWDKAKKFKMSENDYAEKHNLAKVWGEKKYRWIYIR